MLNWDDYRIILAVSRRGGLAGAANELGVTLSTVFRRLERIELQLKTRLFERNRGGYVPTEEGRDLAGAAERMEQEAIAADRAISGRDRALSGSIRITTTELLSVFFLSRHLPEFCLAHPLLDIEVISDNRRLSLADREADLALRVRRPKEPTLFGRAIGRLHWAIYGASGHEARLRPARDLADLREERFVGWDGPAPARAVADWLRAEIPEPAILCRTTSLVACAALAATGAAVAALPAVVGDNHPGLRRLPVPVSMEPPEIWLLTHQDLRRNARVRAVMDFIASVAAGSLGQFQSPPVAGGSAERKSPAEAGLSDP